jgi:hemerythrin-like domain-containing protein
MTKEQIKSIALNAIRKLNAVAKDVYSLDLVTATNHQQLKDSSATLNDLYNVLDRNYQRSMKAVIDEPMEYTELVKKRIDAHAEYIRPTRLKTIYISPKQVVQMLDTEQQAMHHLSMLLDEISIGGKA